MIRVFRIDTDRAIRSGPLLVGAMCALLATAAPSTRGGEAGTPPGGTVAESRFADSSNCRRCHEKFYHLWATSHHGSAMRPCTSQFVREHLTSQTSYVDVEGKRYRVDFSDARLKMHEQGPKGDRDYLVDYVLGGKYVYYCLTPGPRGRWQVLPLAFDVRTREWFDMAGSIVRHIGGREQGAPPWTAREFTFNTSCYGCHVSQLAKNYDPETDTYKTVWTEPGINCDCCHGPGNDHIRALDEAGHASDAGTGAVPDSTTGAALTANGGDPKPVDLRIVRTGTFTPRSNQLAVCALSRQDGSDHQHVPTGRLLLRSLQSAGAGGSRLLP